jgi:hypothetical protein
MERTFGSSSLSDRFWPGAVLRLPGFDRQLTQHSRRSTARITAAFTPQIRGFRSPDSAAHFQDYMMAGV